MSFLGDRRKRRDEESARLEAANRQADSALALVEAQQPRVNALSEWFEERRMTNGLGTDFNYTFQARRSRGAQT